MNFELYPYPANSPMNDTAKLMLSMDRNAVSICLTKTALKYPSTDVIVRCKPTRTFFVGTVFKRGEVHMVPYSIKISMYDNISKMHDHEVQIFIQSDKIFAISQEFNEKFVVPFWAMKTTTKSDEANMKIIYETVTDSAGSSPAKAKKIGSGDDKKPIQILVLMNTRKIDKHEELLYLKQEHAKDTKKRVPEVFLTKNNHMLSLLLLLITNHQVCATKPAEKKPKV